MIAFTLRRIAWVLPTLLLLTFLLFAVSTKWLGSPAAMMLGTDASPQSIAQLNQRYGFDQPIVWQYLRWIGSALTGDLGRSYATQQQVAAMVGPAVPVTLELAAWAISLALIAAVGLSSLVKGQRTIWAALTGVSVVGVTIPNFMLGTTLIYLFSVKLGWLPTTGWVPWRDGAVSHLVHLILPVMTLFAFYFSAFGMIYRTEYRATARQMFVRVARAKGLPETHISFGHILPNAVLPVVTSVGLSIGHLVGGAVVTEVVFSIPGLGRVFVTAIAGYDFPVMLAMAMVVLAGVMVANLLADLALASLNPQVRL